jgi:pimeloyl-ACP methyl ester carboxylesterase
MDFPRLGTATAIATRYRFMAYNLCYHGTAPWPDAGQQYSWVTHTAARAAFLRQVEAGLVHLVGLSSGGRRAALMALEHFDLVRSLTLAEPQTMAELLVDRPETQVALDAWSTAFAPNKPPLHYAQECRTPDSPKSWSGAPATKPGALSLSQERYTAT